MQDAVWFVLITVVGIPVGGSILTLVSDRLGRTTARKTALLAAAQRRREIEISQLRDAQTDLLEAATAVQSYVWYVDKKTRLRTTIPTEDWRESREFVERAVVGAQRLRAIARTMPTDELRDAYIAVERLIMKVVKGSDDETAPDPWHEDVAGPQPDTITRAVNVTADEIKRLYDTYPTGSEHRHHPNCRRNGRTEASPTDETGPTQRRGPATGGTTGPVAVNGRPRRHPWSRMASPAALGAHATPRSPGPNYERLAAGFDETGPQVHRAAAEIIDPEEPARGTGPRTPRSCASRGPPPSNWAHHSPSKITETGSSSQPLPVLRPRQQEQLLALDRQRHRSAPSSGVGGVEQHRRPYRSVGKQLVEHRCHHPCPTTSTASSHTDSPRRWRTKQIPVARGAVRFRAGRPRGCRGAGRTPALMPCAEPRLILSHSGPVRQRVVARDRPGEQRSDGRPDPMEGG